ncbi:MULTISPECIES: GNAT family N-acetyltransferase [Pseudomonas]|jgi:ribosomal protein S18 acetylase RimI-like enzyme|uniref:GNAT family N-acetyltransferase n=1 Tax=Pseudomonas TaxID=286 RepID=UPI000AD68993|nr:MULTISPECIES: GNAT family N-acetyltransferase [Pseudomonas]MBI6621305.1 GNAT family N-acetyltransferase [Pseudomonas corrugata]MBI6695788.1 GNAT family N-acetyltransferase [Pseudomonas corrugata]WRV70994.1 GNAT family N-acetyltransferase [Pseudomonas frederiksbergensis]
MDDPVQQVLLRRAMVRDAERLEQFFRGFTEVSFCEWQDARFLRGVLLQETTTAYMAFDAMGEVVGAVIGGMLGTRGTINHLAVSPRHRTQGLGQRLVEAASADMKRVGVLRMFLFVDDSNLAGKRFWAAQGFCEPRGEITFERDL